MLPDLHSSTATEVSPDTLSGTRFEKALGIIFILSLLLGSYRIFGYFAYNIPYGYDPGFFRHAIQNSLDILPAIIPTPDPTLPYHEPLFGIFSVILTFIGFSSDTIIGPFLGFLSIFTAGALYFFGKQFYSRSLGLLAGSIFLLSLIQYQEYWWNYWRNILGILFLIFSLGLIHKKSPLAILIIAGLFTIHRPSALYFAVVITFTLSIRMIRERKIAWREIIFLVAGGLIALPLYRDQVSFLVDMIEPVSTTIGLVTPSGSFLTTRDFFFQILPYFIVLIPAIFYKMEKKEFDTLFVGFLVGLAWSVLRLFFYNRMLVFFDIFAILLAAYSLTLLAKKLLTKKKTAKWLYAIVAVFFGIQGYLYTTYSLEFSGRHTIRKEEFDIVQNLDMLVPENATILSTYKGYTPWLLGYSKRRILAPGLLENQIWNEEKWNQFYSQADDVTRCQMIQEYRSIAPELYVFVGDNQPPLRLPESCFHPLLSNTSHPLVYEVQYTK